MAFVGGSIQLPAQIYRPLVGAVVGISLGIKLPSAGLLEALGLVLAVAGLKVIGGLLTVAQAGTLVGLFEYSRNRD